jgi:GxxExxY protein
MHATAGGGPYSLFLVCVLRHSELTDRIIGSIVKVHRTLGPGFAEKIYRNALLLELQRSGLHAETEKEVIVRYEQEEVGRHRLDILVDELIVVEVKAVAEVGASHYAQVRSYLRATGLQVGILANFGRERSDFRRIEWPPDE